MEELQKLNNTLIAEINQLKKDRDSYEEMVIRFRAGSLEYID